MNASRERMNTSREHTHAFARTYECVRSTRECVVSTRECVPSTREWRAKHTFARSLNDFFDAAGPIHAFERRIHVFARRVHAFVQRESLVLRTVFRYAEHASLGTHVLARWRCAYITTTARGSMTDRRRDELSSRNHLACRMRQNRKPARESTPSSRRAGGLYRTSRRRTSPPVAVSPFAKCG